MSGLIFFRAKDIDLMPAPIACVVSKRESPNKGILISLEILKPSCLISFRVFPKFLSNVRQKLTNHI